MNYQTLAAEIALPAYVGMSDADVADALNRLSTATRQKVAIERLQETAFSNGSYTALDVAVNSAQTPDALRSVARTVLALVNARFDAVDLDSAASQQAMGALVQAGVLTAAQMTEIDALADVPGTARWQTMGLAAAVTVEDIQAARDWQAAQAAETARLAAFAALRERVVNGYHGVLAWLQGQQDSGNAAPEWAQVVERM